jgi:hypothetical protein
MPASTFLPLTPTLGPLYFHVPLMARFTIHVSLMMSLSLTVNTSLGFKSRDALCRAELQLVPTVSIKADNTQRMEINRFISNIVLRKVNVKTTKNGLKTQIETKKVVILHVLTRIFSLTI